MLNKKEINEKKKYIINRLKCNIDDIEEQKLRETLAVLVMLETRNDGLKNIKLYNLIGKLSNNYNFVKDDRKVKTIISKLPPRYNNRLSKEYVDFILSLANPLSNIQIDYSDSEFKKINKKEDDIIKLVREFYNSLDNEKIRNNANKIIDDPTHYGFTNTIKTGTESEYGITGYDLVFTKPYISLCKTNDIFEYQIFSHEVMHGIDFYLCPELPSTVYNGFGEFTTYAMDYLLIDYLEEKGFDKDQIKLMRMKKLCYVLGLAYHLTSTIEHIHTLKDSIYTLPYSIVEGLLELESCVLAKAFYEDYKKDKKNALNNLVKYMENPLPKDKTPDFSYVGFDNETLLRTSEKMYNENMKKKIKK